MNRFIIGLISLFFIVGCSTPKQYAPNYKNAPLVISPQYPSVDDSSMDATFKVYGALYVKTLDKMKLKLLHVDGNPAVFNYGHVGYESECPSALDSHLYERLNIFANKKVPAQQTLNVVNPEQLPFQYRMVTIHRATKYESTGIIVCLPDIPVSVFSDLFSDLEINGFY